jgi:hypothetical protein
MATKYLCQPARDGTVTAALHYEQTCCCTDQRSLILHCRDCSNGPSSLLCGLWRFSISLLVRYPGCETTRPASHDDRPRTRCETASNR